MRVAIVGNSGSGKSTLAKRIAESHNAVVLDLDTVAWESGRDAVPRVPNAAERDVIAFCSANQDWVVEGCYANLIRSTLQFGPELVFLDPGLETCLSNCKSRPWEPHKFQSEEEQNNALGFLLAWVAEYYSREDDTSYRAHRALFASYAGPKQHLQSALRARLGADVGFIRPDETAGPTVARQLASTTYDVSSSAPASACRPMVPAGSRAVKPGT